jgi:hypothetical protein
MPRGNPSPKLAITVDSAVHEQVLAAAASEGVSVSAWMTTAARRALRVETGSAPWRNGRPSSARSVRTELADARRRVADECEAVALPRSQ